MRFFIFFTMILLNAMIKGEEIFIPENFKNGQVIEQIILISDVDGVIRESTEAEADFRVIQKVKSLLENKGVEVTFISGTPIENDLTLEVWRRGNVPLSKVFGSSFSKELAEKRVHIYGVLGGQQMKEDGTLEIVDEYSQEVSWELGKLLIHAFLKEVLNSGTAQQIVTAKYLQIELEALNYNKGNYSNVTPTDFRHIIETIRLSLDPNFRLVSNGALIETYTSNPPWNTALSTAWLKEEMNQSQYLVSSLSSLQKQMATGLAKRGDERFNYLLISKTNKGLTTKKHIEEKMKRFPHALIVTIGDTQVDFPMHQNAHIAFHVGLEKVLLNNPLPNCMMVRSESGEDSQHVEGTLKVLSLLEEAIDKSFYDFRYIPKCNAQGNWDYYSLKEIQQDATLSSL